MSFNQTQDIQVTAFYEKVVQEGAFIVNWSTIDKSKIGGARVRSNITTQQKEQ